MDLKPLILASASPRREQLLNQIGLEFSVVPSDVIEDFSLALPPEAFTEHWAREKAKYVAENNPDTMVIGADTIVVLDEKILGKPKNIIDSFSMLQSLSGRTHEVITGVAIIWKNKEIDIIGNFARHKEVGFCRIEPRLVELFEYQGSIYKGRRSDNKLQMLQSQPSSQSNGSRLGLRNWPD